MKKLIINTLKMLSLVAITILSLGVAFEVAQKYGNIVLFIYAISLTCVAYETLKD